MEKVFLMASFVAVLLSSCSTVRYSAANSGLTAGDKTIAYSLFNAKDSTISEANIQKILEGKLNMPSKLRIALVDINNTRNASHGIYDLNLALMEQEYMDKLVAALKENERTHSALPVPKMILNSTTFTAIREAAVRMQTDVVMIYSVSSNTSKYKKDGKKGFRGVAQIQLTAIDVRTGLVPFSSVATSESYLKKVKEANKGETRIKVRHNATLLSLEKMTAEINDFLSQEAY